MAAFFQNNGEPVAARPTSVRVQCEAKDCRALLEVAVSSDCPEGTPVIVSCGSCHRLLEVNLTAVNHGYAQRQAQAHQSFQMAAQTPHMPHRSHYHHHHPSVPGQDPRSLSLTNHLVQPPPLSRYHNLSGHQMRPGYVGHMEPFVNPFHASDLQPHSAGSPYSSTHFGGFDEHSPKHFNQGIRENRFGAVRRKKKDKTGTKPRNPSPYNLFMSREVKRIKSEHPDLDHREAFKQAASNWAKSPNNCSNQRTPVIASGDEPAKVPATDSEKPTESEKPTAAGEGAGTGVDTPDIPEDIVRIDSALAPLESIKVEEEAIVEVGETVGDSAVASAETDGESAKKPGPVVEEAPEPIGEKVEVSSGTKRLSDPDSPVHSGKRMKVESVAVEDDQVCS
ncbi:hypothetical protein BSKO_07992 [Bryopsis sp. KO-2023]|nr:hypothetical protein BSKO_07992 [Bryopsis sp. KO-2023]